MTEATEQLVRFRMPMQVWLAVETVANTLVTAGVVYDAAVLWAAVEADGKSPICRTLNDRSLAGIVASSLTVDEDNRNRHEPTLAGQPRPLL